MPCMMHAECREQCLDNDVRLAVLQCLTADADSIYNSCAIVKNFAR
jgi:hypothetical protein